MEEKGIEPLTSCMLVEHSLQVLVTLAAVIASSISTRHQDAKHALYP